MISYRKKFILITLATVFTIAFFYINENTKSVFSNEIVTANHIYLSYVEVKKDLFNLDGAWSVTVSPDGSHVYAASSSDNAVAVFSRNSSTGALTYVEVKEDGVGGVDGLEGASSVTVSPDGGHVYAAGYDDNAVAVFSRNSSTGALLMLK